MTSYSNDKQKHGNLWYGWQRLRGVVHNRKRIGSEFERIRTNGMLSVAMGAGAVLSIPFLPALTLVFFPLLAAPVVLGVGSLYNIRKAAQRSKDVFHHSAVNSYVFYKERGQKAPSVSGVSSKPTKGKMIRRLAFGGGTLLLAGAATVAVMEDKVHVQDSFNTVKDAVTGKVAPQKPAVSAEPAEDVTVKLVKPQASPAAASGIQP